MSWTAEERACVLAVREALLEKVAPSALGEIELIAITANAKWRVEEAVTKFMTYHDSLLKEYGIDDVWADDAELDDQWHRLAVAGTDEGGRQMMWVEGGVTQVAEEGRCIRACCLYFFAVHADVHTLRNGISLIINTANAKQKVGNEKKLQVAWQNYPTRPQHIYILGTNMLTRVAVNALIAFASLFAKNKIIARIQFAEVSAIERVVGKGQLPEVHGGERRPPTKDWVRARLAAFPRMGLPAL